VFNFVWNRWKLICAIVFGGLSLFYVGSSYVIGRQVRDVVSVVSVAQASSPGGPVTALLSLVNSPYFSLPEKNRAVWALGQLGNPRALGTLEALFTGGECDHSSHLCQYRLEKAIQLCRGGYNTGAFVWRHGELASR